MRSIRFRVDGQLPPKKDGANSMWGKPREVERLVALRSAALSALDGQPAFSEGIALSLTVHVGQRNSQRSGDLDNYVTGVCDGLMAAHRHFAAKLDRSDLGDVHPSRCIAIADDSAVVRINAAKLFGLGEEPWYEVVLEGD